MVLSPSMNLSNTAFKRTVVNYAPNAYRYNWLLTVRAQYNGNCTFTVREADPLAKVASAAFVRFPNHRSDWTVAGSIFFLLSVATGSTGLVVI
jgi:hypothetical protein